MNRYCWILMGCVIACLGGCATETKIDEWGPLAGNVQMSLRLKEGGTEVRTNQRLDLIVRVRNLSKNKSVTFTKWVGGEAFPPTWSQPVISESSVEPGFYILKDGTFGGTPNLATVPPMGLYEFYFYLSALTQSKTNDIYTIVVQRMVDTNYMVMSNPLHVKVVPGEWNDPFGFP